jgi:hypothetical protein
MLLGWGLPPLVTVLALRRRGEALEGRFMAISEGGSASPEATREGAAEAG